MRGLCVRYLKTHTCWPFLNSNLSILTLITRISFDGLRDARMMGGLCATRDIHPCSVKHNFEVMFIIHDVLHSCTIYHWACIGCAVLTCCLGAEFLKVGVRTPFEVT